MKSIALVVGGTFFLGTGALCGQTPAVTSAPKAYGTGFQSLHVGGAAFHSSYGLANVFYGSLDGYRFNLDGEIVDDFEAPVTLPPGAEVHALCAYLYDDRSDADVVIRLKAGRLVPGGLQPGVVDIGSEVWSSWDTGYGVVCADFVPPYTYSEAAQEDGVALAHYFVAQVPPGGGVGGVKIIWRRQVSPPPATPSFGDVPTDHPFFQFVEALAASGITGGCGSGNFCPEKPLTRAQMAAFLAKALGLHWPY